MLHVDTVTVNNVNEEELFSRNEPYDRIRTFICFIILKLLECYYQKQNTNSVSSTGKCINAVKQQSELKQNSHHNFIIIRNRLACLLNFAHDRNVNANHLCFGFLSVTFLVIIQT